MAFIAVKMCLLLQNLSRAQLFSSLAATSKKRKINKRAKLGWNKIHFKLLAEVNWESILTPSPQTSSLLLWIFLICSEVPSVAGVTLPRVVKQKKSKWLNAGCLFEQVLLFIAHTYNWKALERWNTATGDRKLIQVLFRASEGND